MDSSATHPDPIAARVQRDTAALVRESAGRDEDRVVFADAIAIGREEGDIRIPADPYLSKLHAQVARSESGFRVSDCGSLNGTFVQVRQPIELRPGDEILIGSQLFRVVM